MPKERSFRSKTKSCAAEAYDSVRRIKCMPNNGEVLPGLQENEYAIYSGELGNKETDAHSREIETATEHTDAREAAAMTDALVQKKRARRNYKKRQRRNSNLKIYLAVKKIKNNLKFKNINVSSSVGGEKTDRDEDTYISLNFKLSFTLSLFSILQNKHLNLNYAVGTLRRTVAEFFHELFLNKKGA